jgi:hypothetical protein
MPKDAKKGLQPPPRGADAAVSWGKSQIYTPTFLGNRV